MSPQTQQMIMGLLMWVVVFGVFYFLLIRPQKKKDKELKEKTQIIVERKDIIYSLDCNVKTLNIDL